MSGCRSCSGCAPHPTASKNSTLEKLDKGERSANPRYPLVFVGKQAIYSENGVQIIVTVLEDSCSDDLDCFTLKPTRILKDPEAQYSIDENFRVSQDAGECVWKLQGLI